MRPVLWVGGGPAGSIMGPSFVSRYHGGRVGSRIFPRAGVIFKLFKENFVDLFSIFPSTPISL